ncbi:helix-turn-helix transcriptional regulator [Microlunatus elymi]|uniref:Helix-turn-helix transcriptional regulator n=1 Tax=Microlunatus elymi TaxID=2596828 RepID=A0A516PVE3_9ACTN|nr:helix-turn-helix transcriptional regulator [Microlunatus elymi]QDP95156.1 helix-turn-helix transcriptional regulator [Microlunatus elymi]
MNLAMADDMVIGDLIASIRRANGWSQGDLADELNQASGEVTLTRTEVSRWERGVRVPQHHWARWIADVGGIPFDRVQESRTAAKALRGNAPIPTLNLPNIAPDPDEAQRVDGVVSGLRRPDAATLDWITDCLARHRTAEDDLGAEPIAPVARAQLNAVIDIANKSQGDLRIGAVDLAAQYAQFLGWMAVTTADHAEASAWYGRSREWAEQADHSELAATALSMQAHHAWGQGDARLCQRSIAAADEYDGLSPGLSGMLRQTSARGFALAGDAETARAELERAGELLQLASDSAKAAPDWLYFYDEDWLLRQQGTIELQLGNFPVAVDLLSTGYERIKSTYPRDQAWIGSCLSLALAASGEVDGCVKVANEIADDAVALNRHAVEKLREASKIMSSHAPERADAVRELIRSPA